ncbi:cruciform cutting endonuclease 1, mitochondrial [Aspergillus udagawae]|uniref:Cruciform cutting endonuclease 1, mitochondrial n=1 Tax=Aspergillus udagawae TaxID=91492 RepID=A0A8H3NFF7_9EURO|nr:cruciform cutting endonuclease 1, mitochondrial [Aspergillus udagawae]
MRISLPFLSSYTWLNSLKASQLQRIAQATGIQSSGTKACLIARLKEELPQPEPETQTRTSTSTSTNPMSILSIDMGIQNLAYAHLLVPRNGSSDSGTATTAPAVVKLNAWRRLAVSDALLEPGLGPDPPGKTKEGSTSKHEGKAKEKQKQKEKHTFSPAEYARTAYALVSGLLHAYRPSHVLIERQRFRSGGGSAVQEWTLRVGVFEGMLYAVLHALGCERQQQAGEGAGMRPVVLGLEPRRVGAYWEDRLGVGVGVDGPKKKKKKASAREGKKVKINLAGEWLRAGMVDVEAGSGSPFRLSVADDPELRALVDAYLRRWAGKSNPGTSASRGKAEGQVAAEDDGAVIEPPDVRKMDDLADCLVQGVTWLEWQAMKQRVATEGLDATFQLESGKL